MFFSIVLACQAWEKGFRKPCPAKIKIRFNERATLGRFRTGYWFDLV